MSTQVSARPRRPSQGNCARSSSDDVAVVLINCLPLSLRKYSPSCSWSVSCEPSGVRAWARLRKGFTGPANSKRRRCEMRKSAEIRFDALHPLPAAVIFWR